MISRISNVLQTLFNPSLAVCMAFFLSGTFGFLWAQDPSSLATSQLQEVTVDLVRDGDLIDAIPFLEEIVLRVEELPENQQDALEDTYYYLSIAYLQSYARSRNSTWLNKTVEITDSYLKKYLNGRELPNVLANRADALRAQAKWSEAAAILERALRPPSVEYMKSSVRVDVVEKLAQAYYILEDWEMGIPWFSELFTYKDFPEKVALAAAALVESYINAGRFEEVLELVPVLASNSDARYNIRLNVKLIEGGDALSKNKRFAEAALMYYLTLTRAELMQHHQAQLESINARIEFIEETGLGAGGLGELSMQQRLAQIQVEQLEKIPDYTPDLEWRKARMFQQTGRDFEAFWAFYRLYQNYPEKTDQLENYIYAAFVQAEKSALYDYAIELGEQYILNQGFQQFTKVVTFKLAEVYKKSGELARFESLATRFIIEYPNDDFAGAMVYLMADSWFQAAQLQLVIDRFTELIASFDSAKVLDGLYYWVGLAAIFQEDYELAKRSFTQLVDQYTYSSYLEDAQFRLGVIEFATDNFEAAKVLFRSFVRSYPNSVLRGEAHLFLGDVLAADAQVYEAVENYSEVPNFTEEMDFIDHAYFQAAALWEENDRFDEKEALLREYALKYPSSPNLSKAIFMLGQSMEGQGRPVEALSEYEQAIRNFGHVATSYGVDQIIRAYPTRYWSHKNRFTATVNFLNRLLDDDAFRSEILTDRRSLFDYLGEHPDVDIEVRELVMRDARFRTDLEDQGAYPGEVLQTFQTKLASLPAGTPSEIFNNLKEVARSESNRTLELRMMMAIDEQGEPMDPLRSFKETDLDVASPTSLVWLAGKIRESGDLSLEIYARRALEKVISDYRNDEEAFFQALYEFGRMEADFGNYAAAIGYLSEARNRFPTNDLIGELVIYLGDVHVLAGQYDEAIAGYESILRDREMRGERWAEAQFKIGMTFFNQGLYREAHGYFERVFVAFSVYKEWAARAYLRDAESLISMGAAEDAGRTLREAIRFAGLEKTEVFPELQDLYQSLIQ